MGFQVRSFDELEKKLNKKINDTNGRKSLDVLFDEEFIKKYTNFSSINEMIEESNLGIKTQEDFDNKPEEEWNKFVIENTKFSSWEEMKSKAGNLYTIKHLNL